MSEKNKEILVLTEKEHIRRRSSIYVGTTKETDVKIPMVFNGIIRMENCRISVGMYKIFNEILDNAVDEGKRSNGSMEYIKVKINTKNNEITIEDSGNGFYKGEKINKTTNRSNIETAVSMLRSGSNFDNENSNETLIGTNGLGSALCNCLSEKFTISTINSTHKYDQMWVDFERNEPVIRRKTDLERTGTSISFIPLKEVFKGSKWNKEIIKSMLTFKYWLITKDPALKNLKLILEYDGFEIDLTSEIFPRDSFLIETPLGFLCIWEKYENSGSVSFINSAMCTGIHQKIVNDYINEKLDDTLGHHFYDSFMSLNLPAKVVRFEDQNKTKFASTREEIESIINNGIIYKLSGFFKTKAFSSISKKVEERKREIGLKKIRKGKKSINVKNSNKYFPAIMTRAENLFIVEGLSAMGSLLQKRDPKKDGVYALKGKIKNARNLSDLSENREILELMSILNLDTEGPNLICPFEKIVIATDSDPDGAHITSLLINLFYNWFPWMVKQNKIYFLETPLVSVGDRSKKYYYTLDEFKKTSGKGDKNNTRYLKGLGSLSLDDWEYVMTERRMICLKDDSGAKKHLDMAFGKLSSERKRWLSS